MMYNVHERTIILVIVNIICIMCTRDAPHSSELIIQEHILLNLGMYITFLLIIIIDV